MATALMRFTTSLGADRLQFKQMTAVEEVSRLYEFEVQALDDSNAIAPSSLLGEPACVSIQTPDESDRFFHGVVCRMGLDAEFHKKYAYRLTLRPWLWLLTRRKDTRIFQKLGVVDILKKVFDAYSPDVEFKLTGTYLPYDYCVQYRETDFNFASRLMEQEGIYYYFRHEKTKHTLVVIDSPSAHVPCPGQSEYLYRGAQDRLLEFEAITSWQATHEIQPGRASLSDFDFEHPGTSLLVSSNTDRPKASAKMEIYDYPGTYVVKDEGQRYAKLRIEELQAGYSRVTGGGSIRSLATGYTFTLKDHPRQEQNTRHIVLSTHIEAGLSGYESGTEDSYYRCQFSALEGKERFRPQRITHKPLVEGVHTAMVVGPAGEEIYTDKYGRVKVQFHWDRLGKRDAESSCWIRVSHPWAGKGWGMIALPRIGQEVVVDFVEGDPDRPIITGRVYNGDSMPPYTLPDHATVTTAKSRSSKGGRESDFNELRFEDKKGSEYIWFQAQKDYYRYVKNNSYTTIDNDQFRIVKRDLTEEIRRDTKMVIGRDTQLHVKGKSDTTINGDQAIKVDGKQGTKIAADYSLDSGAVISIKSGADSHVKVGANLGVDAGANVHIKGGANIVIEAGAMITLKAGGSSIVIGPTISITAPMVNINSGGAAGAGSGASPVAPTEAQKPEPPEEPKDPIK